MAANMSSDDFEQKLAELGFKDQDFSSLPESNSSSPAAPDTSDMDKLDATRLQAAQAVNPAPTPSPAPSNEASAEEQSRARSGFSPEFPSVTPSQAPAAPMPAPGEAPEMQTPDYSAMTKSGADMKNAAETAESQQNPLVANPELNDDALKQAQGNQNLANLITNVGQAGSTFSAESIGAKPNTEFFQNLSKQNGIPVEQLLQRREQLMKNMTLAQQMLNYQGSKLTQDQLKQATDPNSYVSKAARGIVKQFEPKLANLPDFDKMSASQIKEFADHFLETEARVEGQKAQREFSQQYKQQAMDQKQATQDNKDFVNFGNKIEGGLASSRAAFGKNANVLRQSDSAQKLLDQIQSQPGGADQRQYFELARTLDTMLSQGSGTISGTKELLPNTSGKKWASVQEFLSNNPQPAALGTFVKRVQDTISRERNYAIQNNAQTIARIAPGYSHLKDKDTDRWNSILGAHGIKTDDAGNIVGYDDKSQNAASGLSPSPAAAPAASANTSGANQNQLVTIRSKKTGTVKTLDPQTASKYLSDPGFEQVK